MAAKRKAKRMAAQCSKGGEGNKEAVEPHPKIAMTTDRSRLYLTQISLS